MYLDDFPYQVECSLCDGTGEVDYDDSGLTWGKICPKCKGYGWIYETECPDTDDDDILF
jgi:DnaJ-class molecular chaperone